jgi:hypothetical protein
VGGGERGGVIVIARDWGRDTSACVSEGAKQAGKASMESVRVLSCLVLFGVWIGSISDRERPPCQPNPINPSIHPSIHPSNKSIIPINQSMP